MPKPPTTYCFPDQHHIAAQHDNDVNFFRLTRCRMHFPSLTRNANPFATSFSFPSIFFALHLPGEEHLSYSISQSFNHLSNLPSACAHCIPSSEQRLTIIILTNLKSHYCSRMKLIKLHSYLNNLNVHLKGHCRSTRRVTIDQSER